MNNEQVTLRKTAEACVGAAEADLYDHGFTTAAQTNALISIAHGLLLVASILDSRR